MIADWQLEMAARTAPPVGHIVAGSTPVVSFGDPLKASVATLGINPSNAEFRRGDVLLSGPARRLATTDSIGAEPGRQLTPAQARAVVADCNAYFTCREVGGAGERSCAEQPMEPTPTHQPMSRATSSRAGSI